MKVIFVDITRMLNKAARLFPTGIERVDVNYLNAIVEGGDEYIPHGVVELIIGKDKLNYLFLISPELTIALIKACYLKWIEGGVTDEAHQKSIELLSGRIKSEMEASLRGWPRNVRVDPKMNGISAPASDTPVYLNCSFLTIPAGKLHLELMSQVRTRPIYVIHDLIHIECPEYAGVENAAIDHLERLVAVATLGGEIIADSHFVAGQIRSVLAEIAVGTNINITVIEPGVQNEYIHIADPIAALDSVPAKFVYVSTIEPRKNHQLLINIWRDLINEMGDMAPELLFIGRRGWGVQGVLACLDRSFALKTKLSEKNNLPDSLIREELRGAKASLFPSFMEGWGLPIVESLSLGVPVVCSDIPVHRECTQGFAEFIHPLDGLGWKNRIKEIANESSAEGQLRRNFTKGFKPIPWTESIQQVLRLINRDIT